MPQQPPATFDAYAAAYERELAKGLSLTGEGAAYYAAGRIAWMARRLDGIAISSVLDFGCGTGLAGPLLASQFPSARIVGADISRHSIEIARRDNAGERVSFCTLDQLDADTRFDLAYCNGVFHHIPPAERSKALATVHRWLRPGGHFALWENNPWNPGTRYIMSRVEFDRDAIVISPLEAKRMLRANGFDVIRSDHQFFFPRSLRTLRFAEPFLAWLPLGGQYLTLARTPA